MPNQSILPAEMRGAMTISGYRGVGKSFLAAQADAPDNLAWFDFENKGRGISQTIGNFGTYRALTQEAAGKAPIALFRLAIDTFAELEQDRYTVAVLDNITPLELALNAEAARDPHKYAADYGLREKNLRSGSFGGTRSVANAMISYLICDVLHARGVQLVIAISHIGSQWSTVGPIAGKYSTKGADRWQELSILSLILVPGDNPPVPAAIVQKEQLGNITWDATTQEHTIKRRMPERMPEATFKEIRRYLAEGDYDTMDATERTRGAETAPFSDKLSKEQLAYVSAEIALETARASSGKQSVASGGLIAQTQEKQDTGDVIAMAVRMFESGTPIEQISEIVGAPLVLVRQWVKA